MSADVEAEDAILVDSSDDEVIVADEPDDVISGEMSLTGDDVMEPALLSDEVMLSPSDADSAGQVEVEPPPVPDVYEEPSDQAVVADFEPDAAPNAYDPAIYDAPDGEPTTGEFSLVDDQEPADEQTGNVGIPVNTQPAGIPLTTVPHSAPVGLGDDEHEAPTRVSPRLDPSLLYRAPPAVLEVEDEVVEEVEEEELEPPTTTTPLPDEPVEAPPDDEPAGEECDEATFFVEQGLYDEAREILETVLIAYPDHRRAAELLAQVDAAQSSGGPSMTMSEGSQGNGASESRDAFDLAAELANELGDFGDRRRVGRPTPGREPRQLGPQRDPGGAFLPLLQRLGASGVLPAPNEVPPSSGFSFSRSAFFSFAENDEVWPTWWSTPCAS